MTEDLPNEPPIAPASGIQPVPSRSPNAVLFGVAFIVVPILVVFSGIVAIVIASLLPFRGESAQAFRALTGTLIVELSLVGFLVFVVRRIFRRPFLEAMRWSRHHGHGIKSLLLLGAGLAVAVMAASTLFPPTNTPIEQLLTTSEAVAFFAVFGIAFAPFLEEIIFRGFYFRIMEELAGATVAVPFTALLFTLPHVPQLWGSWPAMAVILAVGYLLSRLRCQTNSLIPPFIVHTAYNGTLFLVATISMLLGDSP